MLGKRKRVFDMAYSKRQQTAAVVRRAQGRRTYARTRGPYRTGGFYGASVRSPGEKKVIDVAQTTTAVNTTGSVTLLNGVATGTDFTDRIGRRTNVTAIQLRGFFTPDLTSATITQNLARILIVEDQQTNGVIATIADILNAVTPTSFMNMSNRERFKVHMDQQLALGPQNFTSDLVCAPCPGGHVINFYKKVNIPMVFEGTAATIASISSGALYLVTVGNVAAGNLDSQLLWSSRVRFIDA